MFRTGKANIKRNMGVPHMVFQGPLLKIFQDNELNSSWISCKGRLKLPGTWAGAFILLFVIAFLLVILIRILMVSFKI